jgi:hypothetical protein
MHFFDLGSNGETGEDAVLFLERKRAEDIFDLEHTFLPDAMSI